MKSWIKQPKKTCTTWTRGVNGIETLLDNNYQKIESVPGLKTSLFQSI
jgi:hypothetical protein